MRMINLEQKTSDWHEFRKHHIGASEISAICGICPYKTRRVLWEIKKEERVEQALDDFILIKAAAAESDFLIALNERLKIDFTPIVVESSENPRLSASLDGINLEKKLILEVKFSSLDYVKLLKQEKNEVIRKDHLYQLQFQMMVTGFNEALYGVVCSEGDSVLLKVPRNEMLIEIIKSEAEDFLKSLDEGIKPEPVKDEPVEILASSILGKSLSRIAKLQTLKDKIDSELEKEKKIVNSNSHENLVLIREKFQIQALKIKREGSISWAKLVKTEMPDMTEETINKYKGKATEYWKYSVKEIN